MVNPVGTPCRERESDKLLIYEHENGKGREGSESNSILSFDRPRHRTKLRLPETLLSFSLIFAAAPLSLLGVEKVGTQFGSEALARQAQWRHLVMHGLAQSKPSGQAQACTRQAPAALDGTTGLV